MRERKREESAAFLSHQPHPVLDSSVIRAHRTLQSCAEKRGKNELQRETMGQAAAETDTQGVGLVTSCDFFGSWLSWYSRVLIQHGPF